MSSFKKSLGSSYVLIPAIGLLTLIAYPMAKLVLVSLRFSGDIQSLSFETYGSILSTQGTWNALVNSLIVAIFVTSISLTLGTAYAWAVVRTNIPGKRFIKILVFISFTIPSYIMGLFWFQLFGRNGYTHRFMTLLNPGYDYNLSCYSLAAVIVVLSIHLFPLVYFAMTTVFRRMDPCLEQAAILSGASKIQTVFHVTLPLASPQILSIGLLVFARSMANFDVPALLALPVRKELLTTRLYSALSNLKLDDATVLSVLLIVCTAVAFYLGNRSLGRKKFSVEHETHGELPQWNLGKLRTPSAILMYTCLLMISVFPLIILLISSFLKRWGLPLQAKYIGMQNYQALFSNPSVARALVNSLTYGFLGASVALVISIMMIAHSYSNPSSKIAKFLDSIAIWPMATPHVVLAVAGIITWNSPPLRIYGTPWVIIVTYIALFIPLSMRNTTGLLKSLDRNQLHAARLSGASGFRSFRDILFPVLAPGTRTSLILCLLISLREIPISLLLYTSGQQTLGVLLFGMQSQSYGMEMTSTLAIVIMGIIGIIYGISGLFEKKQNGGSHGIGTS
jgi:iron(III) transport system permease protein